MTIQVPPQFVPIIQRAAAETGVPYEILAAQISQESNFNPAARGAAGEIGISQIMPATAQRPGYGLSPIALQALSDPSQAIPWGARYLAARARAAGVTNWADPSQAARGLAAYNGAGPQAAEYGRRVLGMSGRVAPGEPPTADSGDAPLWSRDWARNVPQLAQVDPQAEDRRLSGEVLQALRYMGAYR